MCHRNACVQVTLPQVCFYSVFIEITVFSDKMNFEAGIRSAIGSGLGFQHLPATAGKKQRKGEKKSDFGR